MVEQLVINYWFPYVRGYLKTNNLEPTNSNIRKALDNHNKTLPIRLKKFPYGIISKLAELLK
jgi:hypothetical protein